LTEIAVTACQNVTSILTQVVALIFLTDFLMMIVKKSAL